MTSHAPYTIAAVTAGVVGASYIVYRCYQRKPVLPTEWTQVGTLSDLYIYPIKSCGGIVTDSLECTSLGLRNGWLRDRILVVIDEKNNFITARIYPELLLIETSINNSILTLKYQELKPVDVDLAEGAFPDDAAFHFINQASVDNLTKRISTYPDSHNITHNSFRPNFVLSGASAFEEDKWRYVKIGDNVFEIVKPCNRCTLTTIDPKTGNRDPYSEPLETLKTYRQTNDPKIRAAIGSTPLMGVQMALRSAEGGTVSLNDPIYAA